MTQSIRDVMTPDPVTLPATATLDEAARHMREDGIGDVLVLDGDRMCGVVTDRDIVVPSARPRPTPDMARCEVCGNDYDKAFEVVAAGARHVFDSFECAIHRMAPGCEHCGCKMIGHGIEVDDRFYCAGPRPARARRPGTTGGRGSLKRRAL